MNATPVGSFGVAFTSVPHASGPGSDPGTPHWTAISAAGAPRGRGMARRRRARRRDARRAGDAAERRLREFSRLDVTGSRGIKRGELLELVRESPRLRDLRVAHLCDTGKFSCGDCELFLAACPSLARFECDVGVSAARVKDKDGVLVPGPAELDLAALLAPGGATVIRRLKIHSADAAAARALAAVAAGAAGESAAPACFRWTSRGGSNSPAPPPRAWRSVRTRGRGFPFAGLAMRKANVRCPGAARLALAIRRAADRRGRFDRALAYARERKSRGEDGPRGRVRGRGRDVRRGRRTRRPDVEERARRGSVDFLSADGTATEPRRPTCRLRWLDLGSNLIGDRGGAALGDALGPRVPIRASACGTTRSALRRAPRSARRRRGAPRSAGSTSRTAGSGTRAWRRWRRGSCPPPPGRSTGLRVLQLGFNNIGEVGIKALAEAHAAGKLDHLEHLDLACNVLGPKGAAALVPMLEPHRREEARDARGGTRRRLRRRAETLKTLRRLRRLRRRL